MNSLSQPEHPVPQSSGIYRVLASRSTLWARGRFRRPRIQKPSLVIKSRKGTAIFWCSSSDSCQWYSLRCHLILQRDPLLGEFYFREPLLFLQPSCLIHAKHLCRTGHHLRANTAKNSTQISMVGPVSFWKKIFGDIVMKKACPISWSTTLDLKTFISGH